MNKKRAIKGGVLLLLILILTAYHLVFGYIKPIKLTHQITVLQRTSVLSQIGANVVVYSSDSASMVVDTQLKPLASSTLAKINTLTDQPLSAVVITHWHPDHSGGISVFSEITEVIAHENVAAILSKPQRGFGLSKPGSIHEFETRTTDSLPTRSFKDKLILKLGSDEISLVHFPKAHTNGDAVVYFKTDKVVAIGDLVWPGSFPFVDVHNGGTAAGLEAALQTLIASTNLKYQFVPGHGNTLNYQEIEQYLNMVRSTRQWVTGLQDQGQSLEQIMAAGLPPQYSQWSSALVPTHQWIKMIYRSRGLSN